MTTDTIAMLRLDALHESPFNPRKIFDNVALHELATDIKSSGRVLQPLLVRPRIPPLFDGDPDATAGHEIVFGHRRYRAAELAGLAEVPCMVRAMSDDEARRAQISENLQRTDVHPIEEAEGFQALIDSNSHTADEIAAEFGKSRSYVYGRLKLLEACPEIRRACLAGEIGSEVALLIARLRTPKLQEKALGYIHADFRAKLDDGGKASFRTIRNLLAEKFTLELKGALFDIEDEMLLPSAGHCLRCPKRTGNAPEYADLAEKPDDDRHGYRLRGGADICTDPDCFAAKKAAHLKREAAKLAAAGKVVVDGNAARNSISARGEIKGAYVALSDVTAELARARMNAQKDSKIEPPQIVLIQDPRTGKTHKAVKRAELQTAGVKVAPAATSDAAKYAAQRAKAEAYTKARHDRAATTQALNDAILDRTLQAMATQPRTTQELYWMAEIVFDSTDWNVRKALAKRQGFERPDDLEKVLGQWQPERLALFAIECVLSADAHVDEYKHYPNGGAHARLLTAAAHYGIDPAAVAAEISGSASTPTPAARAPASATAGAGAKKARASAGAKAKGKGLSAPKQIDDAGVAGGCDAQASVLEGAEA